MAFTLNRRLSQLVDSNGQLNTGKIANDYITSDHIADNTVTSAMLHTSFTVSSSNLSSIDTDAVSEGSSNLYYTDARADARVALIVDSAPSTLNTLNELAAALGDDANFSTTVTNSIAAKLPLAGGTMTGPINAGSQNISAINNATAVSFLSTNGYWVGGTQRMNGSGDLVNIGTISSGAITSSGTLTAPTLIAGAYGASGSAGDGFRINSTDLYGQTDSSDKVHLSAVSGNATFAGTISSGAITSSGQIITTQESANSLKTRFLMGKDSGNTNDGDLYINYASSNNVYLGAGGGSSDLNVSGGITAGASTFTGTINLNSGTVSLRGDVALDHDGSSLYIKAPSQIYFYPNNTNRGNIASTGALTLTSSSGTHTFGSSATNLVADFVSTDGTAAIRLRDSGGNVELSTSGGNFQIQPAGGSAVFICDTAGNLSQIQKITTTGTSNDEGIYLGANHRIYGGAIRAFEASTTASGTVQLGEGFTSGKVLISAPRFDYPAELRAKDDSGILRYTKSTAVGESTTTVLTITKTSYSYFVGGTLTLILVDTGSPWGVYYFKRTLVGRKSTYMAGNDMGYSFSNSETHGQIDYTPTFSDSDNRTSGSSGGTISIKVATGSGQGSANCKVIFDGYVAGASLS